MKPGPHSAHPGKWGAQISLCENCHRASPHTSVTESAKAKQVAETCISARWKRAIWLRPFCSLSVSHMARLPCLLPLPGRNEQFLPPAMAAVTGQLVESKGCHHHPEVVRPLVKWVPDSTSHQWKGVSLRSVEVRKDLDFYLCLVEETLPPLALAQQGQRKPL